jgi:hypothetical protein
MTIEIQHGNSVFQYRQNPDNARLVDRRLNRHNARWQPFLACDSAEAALAILLRGAPWAKPRDEEQEEEKIDV